MPESRYVKVDIVMNDSADYPATLAGLVELGLHIVAAASMPGQPGRVVGEALPGALRALRAVPGVKRVELR